MEAVGVRAVAQAGHTEYVSPTETQQKNQQGAHLTE